MRSNILTRVSNNPGAVQESFTVRTRGSERKRRTSSSFACSARDWAESA